MNNSDVKYIDEVELTIVRKFPARKNSITGPEDAVEIFRDFWNKNLLNIQEQMSVMLLSKSNSVIGMYQHSKGGIDSTIIDVELISAAAIKCLAKGVIIAHNHPSGNLRPSDGDKRMSKQLKEALALFNIDLLDSLIIVPSSGYTSLVENGDI